MNPITPNQAEKEKILTIDKAEVNNTSLSLPEAIRKYHSPDENTLYSVTLWGGAHFEGERKCMNENCVNRDNKFPVGKLYFWHNIMVPENWTGE